MRYVIRLAVGAAAVGIVIAFNDGSGPYDGTYAGVALTSTGTAGNSDGIGCVATAAAPAPLTIAKGHAQTKWGTGTLQGDVGSGGRLVMHSEAPGRFEGQIDASGTLVGYYQSACAFDLAWQRQS